MIWHLYRTAGRLAAPGLRRMLLRRADRGKEIPERLNERFGIAGQARPEGRLIWVHAASVGETMSVLPVIQAMAKRVSSALFERFSFSRTRIRWVSMVFTLMPSWSAISRGVWP